MKTYFALVIATIKELVRDRMTLFWFFAFPVIFILLFGLIFSGDQEDMSFDIGLVAESEDNASRYINEAFESIPSFNVYRGNREEEMGALEKGERHIVIVIPGDLESGFAGGNISEIPIFYDAGKTTTSQFLIAAVEKVLNEVEKGISGRPALFYVEARQIQSDNLRQIDFLIPGILAMAVMQLGLFGSLHIVNLREKKILRNIGATPLNRVTLLGSEISVRMIMAIIQAFLIIIIGYLAFKVAMAGSWLALLGAVLLGASVFVSMGYLLVSFTRTEESGMGIIQVVQFPMMFLSGIFFPLELMPDFMVPIVKAIPLTYFGDALRQIMVQHPGDNTMGLNLLVLSAWMVVSIVLAVRFWRWE